MKSLIFKILIIKTKRMKYEINCLALKIISLLKGVLYNLHFVHDSNFRMSYLKQKELIKTFTRFRKKKFLSEYKVTNPYISIYG